MIKILLLILLNASCYAYDNIRIYGLYIPMNTDKDINSDIKIIVQGYGFVQLHINKKYCNFNDIDKISFTHVKDSNIYSLVNSYKLNYRTINKKTYKFCQVFFNLKKRGDYFLNYSFETPFKIITNKVK